MNEWIEPNPPIFPPATLPRFCQAGNARFTLPSFLPYHRVQAEKITCASCSKFTKSVLSNLLPIELNDVDRPWVLIERAAVASMNKAEFALYQ